MLVLSRKIGESITIGEEITIRVIKVAGNRVRLGIEAPGWIKVWRSELHIPLDALSPLDCPSIQEEIPSTAQR
jgi:carbon storage regulator